MAENMPIDFVIVRASSIPNLVNDERSELKAGITGSDIIWESGLGKDAGEEIPIDTFNPNAKRSRLYIGVTERFGNFIRSTKLRDPMVADLSGIMTATKYPRIANDVFSERSVENVQIYPIPGTDEAMQYAFRECDGLLGIMDTDTTRKANSIELLEIFYEVTIRMIKATNKFTSKDLQILNDFKERIAIALARKRMLSS